MSKASNSRKDRFISEFSQSSLEDEKCDIFKRCKFNFSYFDCNQEPAADIATWDESNLQELFNKLKHYSQQALSHWQQERIGSGKTHVLEVYGSFPRRSQFRHPQHVPSDVDWARFRLDEKKRLIGFTVPKELCKREKRIDGNTFYVVFLDPEHKFYLSNRS